MIELNAKNSITIDHNCTKVQLIPNEFIINSKQNLSIAYGHTSHGSQVTSGMSLLAEQTGSIFKYNSGTGSLLYNESLLSGDLGNPDRTTWAKSTRALLNKPNNSINMIMWSWCGQVSSSTESDINTYLNLMHNLEKDFPNVIFVYFTGHLDGTGINGNLNQRNNQIREFCKKNNKILFDFADIESYDPDGNFFLDKNSNDNCDYSSLSGTKNWATEWCNNNPGKCSNCSCAHSQCLNCIMKANAFWWMLARISGWTGPDETIAHKINSDFSLIIYPNPSQDIISININLSNSEYVNCDLIDSKGVKVLEILNNCYFQSGDTKFTQNFEMLSPGIYFIRLRYGRNLINKCFIKN
jgi:hypothetical protein